MQNKSESSIEINGKIINFLFDNGRQYLNLHAICEALDLDYETEIAWLKETAILKDELAELEVLEYGVIQNMWHLPEQYVYGWLFMLKASNEWLSNFQEEARLVLSNSYNNI